MSLRLLSNAMPKVAGKAFSRKYIMLGRLVTHWSEIVGQDLAARVKPVKIHYRKTPGLKKAEASLDIAASTVDATVLHYKKDLILERINQIFGERIVASLRFVPVSANTSQEMQPHLKRRLISADEKQNLSNILDKIDDSALKERLEQLGTSILQKR